MKIVVILDLLKGKKRGRKHPQTVRWIDAYNRIMLLLYTETSGQAFAVFVNVVGMAVLVGNKSQATWYTYVHTSSLSLSLVEFWAPIFFFFFILYFYSSFFIYRYINFVSPIYFLISIFIKSDAWKRKKVSKTNKG